MFRRKLRRGRRSQSRAPSGSAPAFYVPYGMSHATITWGSEVSTGRYAFSATYDFSTAAQLLDWEPNIDCTLGGGSGTMTSTSSASGQIVGVRWKQAATITGVVVRYRGTSGPGGCTLNIYSDVYGAWPGDVYNPATGVGLVWGNGGLHSSVDGALADVLVPGAVPSYTTYYTVTYTYSDTAMTWQCPDFDSGNVQTVSFSRTARERCLGIGGYETNLEIDSITITGTVANEGIQITTSGATFEAIATASGASFIWRFGDGTTSTSAHPSVSFGSAATRTHELVVTPRSALTGLNMGYDHTQDPGPYMSSEADLAGQNVLAINNVQAASALQALTCSMNTGMAQINVEGMTALRWLECYGNSALEQARLSGDTGLWRFCFEGDPLYVLEGVSTLIALRDIRCRFMHVASLGLGTNTANIVHLCTGSSNEIVDLTIDGKTFPLLFELWTWACNNLTGDIAITAPVLSDIRSADCNITSFSMAGCPAVRTADFQNNSFAQAAVDSFLADVVANGLSGTGLTLDLSGTGMAAPSAAGLASITTLNGRGWTVAHN